MFSRISNVLPAFLLFYSGVGSFAAEALPKMEVAPGFTVTTVASEPNIRQPISISFDHHGRMWVIQYLQYPTPAGIRPVKVDQYLRTTYDKIPEPPPRGPKGADRITICEDTDGDGRMDKFKDFVSGLNLCSGMALGYGGAFVVQPPYLLFYADKNHDDIPDQDPEVLLTGFGMEDAHAFANSLTWGPDGWLYGAQGSTVTANIRGIEFQQGIWRYHPRTRRFELFAEGGGNTWGLDFDDEGEIFAGTNFNEKMIHMLQGAYYVKNFGKHGELHNPHAYGYFNHVPFSGYKGLHISVGGIIYRGGVFPKELEGAYIFANTLDHAVYWANLQPRGSTFTASFGGTLLKTDNELFRPVDCQTGLDGAVYIADWTDKRASHVDPLDTWDRSNGRIYKIETVAAEATRLTSRKSQNSKPFDIGKFSSDQLADLLSDKNDWLVRAARQILAERRDAKIIPRLQRDIFESKNERLQLQSLWALYVSGGFNNVLAEKLLEHSNANVRKWTIRFLGDTEKISNEQKKQLVQLAKSETNATVRAQLACSLKRLSGKDALPILRELFLRDDSTDVHIPLLLWWALENKCITNQTDVLELFSSPEIRKSPLVREHILERLARRYASEGKNLIACAKLLESANAAEQELFLKGMEKGLVGQEIENVPPVLQAWLNNTWPPNVPPVSLISFGLRLGDSRARQAALNFVANEKKPVSERIRLIEIFGQTGQKEIIPILLAICEKSNSQELKSAALTALRQFPEVSVGEKILELFRTFSAELRPRVTDMLSSRLIWARLLVNTVEQGAIKAGEVSRGRVEQMVSFKDADLNKRVEKLWGKIQTGSPAEKQNFINHAKLVLKPSGVVGRDAKGNIAEGKKIFQQSCAVCHKLSGEGNNIGPDLSGFDRKNTEFMLANIVNPSAYIRPEFVSFDVETKDDQIVSGLMVESTATAVVLLDRTNQRHTISREQIKELRESQISLMPEGLLESLAPQQLMDLFSYMQQE